MLFFCDVFMNLTASVLENAHVRLEPLDEGHRTGVEAAVNADPAVWRDLYSYPFAGEHFAKTWDWFRSEQAAGRFMPFVAVARGEVVGHSGYGPIEPANRAVEIGSTYFAPTVRGGRVNPAAKLLMLAHAFDCGANRVTFRVDAANLRSRAAVLKLGAVQEALLRQDRVVWTGRVRDTVVFSILKAEWPAVREGLEARLA